MGMLCLLSSSLSLYLEVGFHLRCSVGQESDREELATLISLHLTKNPGKKACSYLRMMLKPQKNNF